MSSLISVSSIFLFSAPSVFAQVGVSPIVIEEQSINGRAQGVITLTNDTNAPIRVRLGAEPFTYDLEGFESLSEADNDLSSYLQFSPREAVIPARGIQRIRILSLFPPDLPDGEYRAVVFAEELIDETQLDRTITLDIRIGSTIYVHHGDLSGSLTAVSAQPSSTSTQLDLVVRNEGTATVRAGATWQLNQAGREVASGMVTPHTVIAEGARQLSLTLPESLPAGSYTLTGDLYWLTLGQENTQPFELPITVP